MWSFFSRAAGSDFPYEVGEVVSGFEAKSIFSLHKGRRKGVTANDSAADVSIFVYDIKTGSDVKLEIARALLKRLKTLRHPSILQYLDSLETDKVLYIATEPVEPLALHIGKLGGSDGTPQRDLYLAWGIFQITRALSFMNNDGSLRHNNVSAWSVFVNASGEWKLGGLEYVTPVDGSAVPPVKVTPALELYDPPEKNDQAKLKHVTKW